MNIFIITQDDPFYLPVFFSKIINQLKNEIVGVTILSESKSKTKTLKKFYNFYGPRLFCAVLFWYIIYKISDIVSDIFPVRNLHSIGLICKRHNVRTFKTNDINSIEFINRLKDLKVDLVVSVASPQIFKRELMDASSLGCINIHGAPLPKYRGMLPSFWLLFNNEKKGAVTAHYINEALDGGDIILQREYDIEPGISHHELILKSKKMAADLLIESLEFIRNNKVQRQANDGSQATYYSFPTKEDLKKFYKMGGRLR